MSGPLLDARLQLELRDRPSGKPVMVQKWRDLTFLHFSVAPEVVQRTLPAGLEVDTFDDKAWIGLVPFWMTEIRYAGWPRVPGAHTFPETNVRTYVHRNGTKPGVWFYSLDAANLPAVLTARKFFNLPYHHARMEVDSDHGSLRYASRRLKSDAEHSIEVQVSGECSTSEPGSFAFWLLERYLLYAHRNGQLFTGQVHHRPYELTQIELTKCRESMIQAAGFNPRPWEHSCYSPGVDVEVFRLARDR